jgi:hypothetical protein
MSQPTLAALVDRIAEDGRVDADEVLEIRRAVFPDGAVDRAEAAALFALAARVANDDPEWAEAFAEAIADHVVGEDRFVHEADVDWLIAQAPRAGALRAPMLLKVLQRAECAPERLAAAAREAVAERIGTGPLLVNDLADIRTCLFALAGDAAAHVSAEELAWLFAIDAATDGRDNDPAWPDLFVKAALNHATALRVASLLSRNQQRDRLDWLRAPVSAAPLSFLARAAQGGLAAYRRRIDYNVLDDFETYYETRLAEAAVDARLTLDEVTRLVTLVRADGRRTANEQRLLDEVARLEAEQKG